MRKHRKAIVRTLVGLAPAFSAAAFLAAFLLLTASVPAQEGFQADPGMVSIGKGLFKSYCTSCHGPGARGDGPLAEYLTVTPTDLTTLSRKNGSEFPFEDVMKKIDGRQQVKGHGSSDMPVWGEVLLEAEGGGDPERVERRVTALAYFLMSIQATAEGS